MKYIFLSLIFIVSKFQPLAAFDDGDMMLTLYGTYIHPQYCNFLHIEGIPNSAIKFDDSGGISASFRVAFLTHLGIELGTGITHQEIKGRGSLVHRTIGNVWFQPITLMLQYYFNPCAKSQFHIGAGYHYSRFFDEHSKLSSTKLEVRDTRDFAAEFGMDYLFTETCFFSIQAKYLRLRNYVTFTGDLSGKVPVFMNPWLVSIGFGSRF